MSYTYDSKANTKPFNQVKLYLNNAGYTQQQNNIYNHESEQKLDTSALSTVNEISGTDCVGLLIEHWRNVAGAGDDFRNFGTGVVAPALSNMQGTLVNLDNVLAKKIISSDSVPHRYNGGLGADPYDSRGKFGGNQSDIGTGTDFGITIWFEDDDIYDFVRRHPGFENYDDGAVHDFLKEVEKEGCTFVAMANVIFDQFYDNPEEFKHIFGFDMFGKDGDLNYAMLTIDIFIGTAKYIYLDDESGLFAYLEYLYNWYLDNPDKCVEKYNYKPVDNSDDSPDNTLMSLCYAEAVNTWKSGVSELNIGEVLPYGYFTINRFDHYCKMHGIKLSFDYINDNKDTATVQKALNDGWSAILLSNKYNLTDINGKNRYVDGGHAQTIAGVSNNTYIVSSWGKKYNLDPINNVQEMGNRGVFLFKLEKEKTFDDLKERLRWEMTGLKGLNLKTECLDVIKKYPGYGNLNCTEADELIDRFERDSSYAHEAARSIYNAYSDDPQNFEMKFGIPMVREDGTPNIKLLALDIFLSTENSVYFDEPYGKEACAYHFFEYFTANPDMYKASYKKDLFDIKGKMSSVREKEVWNECLKQAEIHMDIVKKSGSEKMELPSSFGLGKENRLTFVNRVSHYFKEHNIGANIDILNYTPKPNEISELLEAGNEVYCWTSGIALMDKDGYSAIVDFRDAGLGQLRITGVKELQYPSGEKEEVLVVSKGDKEYCLKTNSVGTNLKDFCVLKYVS